jgi:hypothetical protein
LIFFKVYRIMLFAIGDLDTNLFTPPDNFALNAFLD